MQSPGSSPSKGGGYMGGSGPPTPEGLQYQHSAGSSQATTPAQNTGNNEWDMFFANRFVTASFTRPACTGLYMQIGCPHMGPACAMLANLLSAITRMASLSACFDGTKSQAGLVRCLGSYK